MASAEENLQSEQKANDLTKQIKKAVKGMNYVSESDAPIKLFMGKTADGVTQENLLSQIGGKDNEPVETVNFDDFFAQLTALQDWFGDEEKKNAEKFANLRDLLKNNLRDLNVFKIGSSEKNIYAVGLDADNNLMGIQTKSVET